MCLEEIGPHVQIMLTILNNCIAKMAWKPNSDFTKFRIRGTQGLKCLQAYPNQAIAAITY
jgi:uncharacterized protein (UPF0248 family)